MGVVEVGDLATVGVVEEGAGLLVCVNGAEFAGEDVLGGEDERVGEGLEEEGCEDNEELRVFHFDCCLVILSGSYFVLLQSC
jgi:hypothetical protein